MKLLIAAIFFSSICYSDINNPYSKKNNIRDTTKWRLVLMESSSRFKGGSDRLTMDFSDKKTMMYLAFIDDKQVITYHAFRNYKPDTGTYRRSRDTLFMYRYKSGKVTGNDSFLVKQQSADSLILNQINHDRVTTLRFSSKDLYIKEPERYKPELGADFYNHATKWKVLSSVTQYTYDTEQTASASKNKDTVLLKFRTNSSSLILGKNNEMFLFLSNDPNNSIVVSGGAFLEMSDTFYYRKRADTIFTGPPRHDTMLIRMQSPDSLVLVTQKRDSVQLATTTSRYVRAGSGKPK